MSKDTTLIEALHLWLGNELEPEYQFHGISFFWWGRFGKFLQFIAGLGIVVDLIGPERLETIREFLSNWLNDLINKCNSTIQNIFRKVFPLVFLPLCLLSIALGFAFPFLLDFWPFSSLEEYLDSLMKLGLGVLFDIFNKTVSLSSFSITQNTFLETLKAGSITVGVWYPFLDSIGLKLKSTMQRFSMQRFSYFFMDTQKLIELVEENPILKNPILKLSLILSKYRKPVALFSLITGIILAIKESFPYINPENSISENLTTILVLIIVFVSGNLIFLIGFLVFVALVPIIYAIVIIGMPILSSALLLSPLFLSFLLIILIIKPLLFLIKRFSLENQVAFWSLLIYIIGFALDFFAS